MNDLMGGIILLAIDEKNATHEAKRDPEPENHQPTFSAIKKGFFNQAPKKATPKQPEVGKKAAAKPAPKKKEEKDMFKGMKVGFFN